MGSVTKRDFVPDFLPETGHDAATLANLHDAECLDIGTLIMDRLVDFTGAKRSPLNVGWSKVMPRFLSTQECAAHAMQKWKANMLHHEEYFVNNTIKIWHNL